MKPFVPVFACAGWLTLPASARQRWLCLGAMVFTVAVLEITAYVLMSRGAHNLWLYNVYLMVEYGLAVWLVLSAGPSPRVMAAAGAGAVVAIASIIIDLAAGGFTANLFHWTPMLNAFLLSALYTIALVVQAQCSVVPVQRTFWFWVAFAGLIFHGCTLPLNGLFRFVCQQDGQLADRIYILNDIPYIIHFTLLTGALLAYRKLDDNPMQVNG